MTTFEPGSPPPPIQPGGTSTGSSASSQALAALIVGILGIISCWILSPVAWYLGSQELKSIREGRSPVAGEALANVGRILGMVGTVLFGFLILWICLGGFAIIMAALHNAAS